jgi:hypothetical protein
MPAPVDVANDTMHTAAPVALYHMPNVQEHISIL